MRPVSAAFLRTVRGSHRMVARARVLDTFQTGTTPTGTEVTIDAGDVVHDATAKVRATLDLTVTGVPFPTRASDLLAPYGNEIFIERGVAYGNGAVEMVSQGYFRIDTVEQETSPDGPVRISAQDRMQAIIDARLERPLQFTAGTRIDAVVDQLVRALYPDVVIEWPDGGGNATLARSAITDDDRYGFLDKLITAAGKIWYFDYRGVLVIKDPPDPSGSVFEVNSGKGGVLVEMSRTLSRQGVYNTVVATGEAGDATPPARAVARDDNPNSPTYWLGRFGQVPRFFASPFLATNAQAFAAARSILVTSLGLPYNVDFTAVPNPALEPLDPITITYPVTLRSGSTRAEKHVIDRITVPLVPDQAIAGTTREQTLTVISEGAA